MFVHRVCSGAEPPTLAAMRTTPLAAVLLLFVTVSAHAKDEAPASPADRAAAVLKALPSPTPDKRLSFEGDLVIDGLWAGEVSYTANARMFAGKSTWHVTEVVFIDWGGAELNYKASYQMGADLAITSGSAECRHRGAKVSVLFARKGDGFNIMRTIKPPQGKTVMENSTAAIPHRSTYGRAALLLFVRGLGAKAAAGTKYELAWFPLWEMTTEPAMKGAQAAKADAQSDPLRRIELTVKGERKPKDAKRSTQLLVDTARNGKSVALVLDAASKALHSVEAGEKQMSVLPRGSAGQRVQLNEEKPATTWKQAFMKFGYGYHMARPKLIEESFHWESMLAYERDVSKSWPADKGVDAFKAAWIKEFLAGSQHRTRAQTDRLLSMTLGTGKVKSKTDTTIVFAAHANFGGGTQRTYYLKKVEGLWYIWRIDF